MFTRAILACLLAGLLFPSATADPAAVGETREVLSKWIETRQVIAKTRMDWESDRELLQRSIELFEKELASLGTQGEKATAASRQVEVEREGLLKEKGALAEASAETREILAELETKILALAPSLPAPLLEKIDPLLKRIPTDQAETRLTNAERMQTVVGALSEVDKFNGAITVTPEVRKNSKGEEVQARALYLGLGQAYYVDKAGLSAGAGTFENGKWVWTERNDLAPTIARAIAIYENTQPPAFVTLPVILK